MTSAEIILWVYIVLLELGGIMGFVKAGSKASLIASTIFAAVLVLFALNILPFQHHWIVLLFLAVFFGRKYMRSKKFMPSGLMLVLSILAAIPPILVLLAPKA